MISRERFVSWTLVAVVSLVLLPAGTDAQTTHTVTLENFQFNPPTVTIKQGDIVRWSNTTAFSHTTTSGPNCTTPSGLWSAPLNPGQEFSRVFNEDPGTIPYFCIPHCLGGMTGNVVIDSPPTGIERPPAPAGYVLHQNVPNPFSPSTTIEYEVDNTARVEIQVYNIKGLLIASIENDVRTPGRYPAIWHGKDAQGAQQATGVYFYQMKIDGVAVEMKKMVLLR